MLLQSLSYSNFCYILALDELYIILVRGQSQKYKGLYFQQGGPGPYVASLMGDCDVNF